MSRPSTRIVGEPWRRAESGLPGSSRAHSVQRGGRPRLSNASFSRSRAPAECGQSRSNISSTIIVPALLLEGFHDRTIAHRTGARTRCAYRFQRLSYTEQCGDSSIDLVDSLRCELADVGARLARRDAQREELLDFAERESEGPR